MEPWVVFTLMAALMQALRTAAQKRIANVLSPMATTLVRYLFGLPIALLYLYLLTFERAVPVMREALDDSRFVLYASLAAVAQILATVALVKVLTLRNFAVGTSLAKTEALQSAILGFMFFGASLSGLVWLAVLVGVIGVVFLGLPRHQLGFDRASMAFGLLAGVAFAATAVWIRYASTALATEFIVSAAITLLYMVVVQTLLCLIYIVIRARQQLRAIVGQFYLACFVGLTSAIGSIGWYTAMTYENAALVKSLGQVEIVFTLLISRYYFSESISRLEASGITAIIVGVLLILSQA